ncbi:MAG: acyl carrier protein [Syntrophorhabdales bacterium]|jgi:acyl carrier protein
MSGIDKEHIRRIVARVTEMDPEEILDESHLVDDLGIDSIMALEILALIEKELKIGIPEEKLDSVKSANLNGLVQLLEELQV